MPNYVLKLLVALTLWIPASARAGTLIVPDDFPTIQEAVDHVAETFVQDTVLVRPGTYPEKVIMRYGLLLKGLPSEGNPDKKPQIDGLIIRWNDGSYFEYQCVGFHVTGPAVVHWADGPMRVGFESCQFDSGVVDSALGGVPDTEIIALKRCTTFGTVALCANIGVVDSSVVHGPLVFKTEYKSIIRANRFIDIPGAAVTCRARDVHCAGNLVQGAAAGFVVRSKDAGSLLIEDNEINDWPEPALT